MSPTLLAPRIRPGQLYSNAAPPAEDPELGLGWPGLDPTSPCVDFYIYDHSGSMTGFGGNDPAGARFSESAKAIELVRTWTRSDAQKVAIVHFDQPSVGDSGIVTLNAPKAESRITRALRVPPDVRGSSTLLPALNAVDTLIRNKPGHLYRLTIFSDFELMDSDTDTVFQRLVNFPGEVHAVVLNAEPPLELAGQNITITRIGPNDPPGAVAAAVHRSLTATRRGRRLSERHAGRTQPSIPPLSPGYTEGTST